MGALCPIVVPRILKKLPDYLPARMVNEFAYCPRLFFYEWVEGVFAESVDTVEGAIQHKRVDAKATALPESSEVLGENDPCALGNTVQRTAAGDREDGLGGVGRGDGDAGRLQARASTGGEGRARVVALGSSATRGAGNRPARERVCVRRRDRLLPQDRSASARGIRRGADRGDGSAYRKGVGYRAARRDSLASRGLSEMCGMFAEFDLSAG